MLINNIDFVVESHKKLSGNLQQTIENVEKIHSSMQNWISTVNGTLDTHQTSIETIKGDFSQQCDSIVAKVDSMKTEFNQILDQKSNAIQQSFDTIKSDLEKHVKTAENQVIVLKQTYTLNKAHQSKQIQELEQQKQQIIAHRNQQSKAPPPQPRMPVTQYPYGYGAPMAVPYPSMYPVMPPTYVYPPNNSALPRRSAPVISSNPLSIAPNMGMRNDIQYMRRVSDPQLSNVVPSQSPKQAHHSIHNYQSSIPQSNTTPIASKIQPIIIKSEPTKTRQNRKRLADTDDNPTPSKKVRLNSTAQPTQSEMREELCFYAHQSETEQQLFVAKCQKHANERIDITLPTINDSKTLVVSKEIPSFTGRILGSTSQSNDSIRRFVCSAADIMKGNGQNALIFDWLHASQNSDMSYIQTTARSSIAPQKGANISVVYIPSDLSQQSIELSFKFGSPKKTYAWDKAKKRIEKSVRAQSEGCDNIDVEIQQLYCIGPTFDASDFNVLVSDKTHRLKDCNLVIHFAAPLNCDEFRTGSDSNDCNPMFTHPRFVMIDENQSSQRIIQSIRDSVGECLQHLDTPNNHNWDIRCLAKDKRDVPSLDDWKRWNDVYNLPQLTVRTLQLMQTRSGKQLNVVVAFSHKEFQSRKRMNE